MIRLQAPCTYRTCRVLKPSRPARCSRPGLISRATWQSCDSYNRNEVDSLGMTLKIADMILADGRDLFPSPGEQPSRPVPYAGDHWCLQLVWRPLSQPSPHSPIFGRWNSRRRRSIYRGPRPRRVYRRARSPGSPPWFITRRAAGVAGYRECASCAPQLGARRSSGGHRGRFFDGFARELRLRGVVWLGAGGAALPRLRRPKFCEPLLGCNRTILLRITETRKYSRRGAPRRPRCNRAGGGPPWARRCPVWFTAR